MLHVRSMLVASWEKYVTMIGVVWQRDNFVIDSNEHQAQVSTGEMLTFALKECCLLLLCSTVVIAATHAHVGLLD